MPALSERPVNVGLCADGPMRGQEIVSTTQIVNVPIVIPGQPGYGSATYVWFHGVWRNLPERKEMN